MSYCEDVNFLLVMYANKYIIAQADMDIMNFKHPAGKSAVQYGQALWMEGLRWRDVYDDYRQNVTFFEGTRKPIRQIDPRDWAKSKSASPKEFAFHEHSLAILQLCNAKPELGQSRPARTRAHSRDCLPHHERHICIDF